MTRSAADNALLVLLVGLALLWTGCENRFDPLSQEDGTYSIYGALNIYADTNHVRVKNLNAPFTADATQELDVTVTLTDEDRGLTEMLQDSVVQYDNIYTHNFRALMDLRPETQYRVTVHPEQGSDSVHVTTTTPQIAEATAQPIGMDCRTPIQLTIAPVQSPDDIKVIVGFRHQGQREEEKVGLGAGDGPNQATTTFTPLDILNRPRPCRSPDSLEPTWCHELSVDELYIQYTHFGPQSDQSIPADSASTSGGIGSFRSYYRDDLSVPIDTTNLCAPRCGCDAWTPLGPRS